MQVRTFIITVMFRAMVAMFLIVINARTDEPVDAISSAKRMVLLGFSWLGWTKAYIAAACSLPIKTDKTWTRSERPLMY